VPPKFSERPKIEPKGNNLTRDIVKMIKKKDKN
jgi:hypothetical protein